MQALTVMNIEAALGGQASRDVDMEAFHGRLRAALADHFPASSPPTIPTPEALLRASSTLPKASPAEPGSSSTGEDALAPLGHDKTTDHLLRDILPALSGQSLSPRYYGFVTGSVHPAAQVADALVSTLDQNVQVHLPNMTAATEIEDATLNLLADLLHLDQEPLAAETSPAARDGPLFPGRTFTTGATGSNILGLACGRESVIASRLPPNSGTVGELGILAASAAASVRSIEVLTSMGHSSLGKASSVVGLGSANVRELPFSSDEPWRLDIDAVERLLEAQGEEKAYIIGLSFGEVNTGRFAVRGLQDMLRLRKLADKYRSWIHVDAAFGVFAAALESGEEFSRLHDRVQGIQYADSITVDGHKLLNVKDTLAKPTDWQPYDCGMFFTRSLQTLTAVCTNPNAAYLAAAAGATIPSPLNIGLENSRRFRALPAYAVLRSEGRQGLAEMLGRMVRLARSIAAFIRDSEYYDWLPDGGADLADTHIIVLFRAKDETLNETLVAKINETRDMFVSGTAWKGKKAVRLAVGSWRVNVERDTAVVKEILASIAEGRPYSKLVA